MGQICLSSKDEIPIVKFHTYWWSTRIGNAMYGTMPTAMDECLSACTDCRLCNWDGIYWNGREWVEEGITLARSSNLVHILDPRTFSFPKLRLKHRAQLERMIKSITSEPELFQIWLREEMMKEGILDSTVNLKIRYFSLFFKFFVMGPEHPVPRLQPQMWPLRIRASPKSSMGRHRMH